MSKRPQLGNLGLALVLCLAVLLSGYGVGAGAGKVTIRFWDPDTRADWVAARNAVMNDFVAKHPDVEFALTTTDWSSLIPKLQAVVAAGASPDLYYFDSPVLAFGAYSQDLILPMTDVIKTIGADKWPTSMIQPITVNGQMIAFPLYVYPQVLWYRKDLFDKAHLPAPTTLGALLKAAQALDTPPTMYGSALFNDPDDPQIVAQICASFGCTLLDNSGRIAINSPATVQALGYLKKLWQTGSPDAISKSSPDARVVFLSGHAATLWSSVSMVGLLVKGGNAVKIDQLGLVAVPNQSGKVPSTLNLFANLVIPRGAKNVAAAKQFLEFWATPQEMRKFGEETLIGHIPAMKSVYDPGSPYWTSQRIAPVAQYLKIGIAAAAKDGFIGGMYPRPSVCGARLWAGGLYTQMASHLVVDDWSPEKVASWAQDEAKRSCNQ